MLTRTSNDLPVVSELRVTGSELLTGIDPIS